mmetsp:Transcript_1729/g.3639  ORF Transcript_1729/g.3639 Transcript_1729/m.3639 type:complete len:283 (-) Transcript_1729:219-1067(-)
MRTSFSTALFYSSPSLFLSVLCLVLLDKALLLEEAVHGSTDAGRALHNSHVGALKGGDLVLCSSLTTSNDGTGMTHSAAGGSGTTSNEANDGLVTLGSAEEVSGLLFHLTTDLTDEHDTLGLGVYDEALKAVNKVGAVEGIASNTDASGLTEANIGGLVYSLVGESARARDNSDTAGLVDVSRHNTDLAFTRLDDTGAVRSDEPGLAASLDGLLHLDHVVLGNTLSDGDNEGYLGLNSLKDGGGGERRGHVDDGGVTVSSLPGITYGVEDGESKMLFTTLAW